MPGQPDIESGPDNKSGPEIPQVDCGDGPNKEVVPAAGADVVVASWDGPDDPVNPMNWPHSRKVFTIVLVSAVTFNMSLAATIFAPGVPQLMREFSSTSTSLASFVVSAYIVPFIFGPLIFAPLSELYGRNIIMHTSNVFFFVFTILCAVSRNIPMFVIFRLFQGLSGCVPVVLGGGGGTIGDLMPPKHRGKAMSEWQLGPLLGPVLGPVIGGYVAENIGWRWLFWLVAILAGILAIATIFVPETYTPTLLARKAARLRKETGNPSHMLFRSPIVMFLALEASIVYGYLYLLFTTFTFVFQEMYGFGPGAAGLAHMGLGVGFLVGLFGTGATSDRIAKKKAAGSAIQPEHRLPPLIFGAVLIGIMFVFMPIQSYLIDAFTVYAASAIATNTVVRSLFGAVLPLAGQPMYAALGLGRGNSLLAFIDLATVPLNVLLMKNGQRIRCSLRFQLDL